MTKEEKDSLDEAWKQWLTDATKFDVKEIQEIIESIEKMLHVKKKKWVLRLQPKEISS